MFICGQLVVYSIANKIMVHWITNLVHFTNLGLDTVITENKKMHNHDCIGNSW